MTGALSAFGIEMQNSWLSSRQQAIPVVLLLTGLWRKIGKTS